MTLVVILILYSTLKAVFNFQDVKSNWSFPHSLPWNERYSIPVFRGSNWNLIYATGHEGSRIIELEEELLNNVSNRTMSKQKAKDLFFEQVLKIEDNKKDRRLHLVYFSMLHPNLVNARLTSQRGLSQNSILASLWAQNASNGFDRVLPFDKIPQEEYYTEYQTHIVMGGVGAAFRTARIMKQGIAVILQDFPFEEWFTHLLVPYVHYIPLDQNLSNLNETLYWVRDNPSKVFDIANNGKLFYDMYLSKDQMADFYYELIFRLMLCCGGGNIIKEEIIGVEEEHQQEGTSKECHPLPQLLALNPGEVNTLRRTLGLENPTCYEHYLPVFAEYSRNRQVNVKKHISLHIPKTAGTSLCSLAKSLEKEVPPTNNCFESRHFYPLWCCHNKFEDRKGLGCDEIDNLPSFTMNENYLDHPLCLENRIYSVLLRSPIERALSQERHLGSFARRNAWKNNDTEIFSARLMLAQNNYMTWALAIGSTGHTHKVTTLPNRDLLNVAKKTLLQLDFLLDPLHQRHECITATLGLMDFENTMLPHKNKDHKPPHNVTREKELNALDIELYQYATKLMELDCNFILEHLVSQENGITVKAVDAPQIPSSSRRPTPRYLLGFSTGHVGSTTVNYVINKATNCPWNNTVGAFEKTITRGKMRRNIYKTKKEQCHWVESVLVPTMKKQVEETKNAV